MKRSLFKRLSVLMLLTCLLFCACSPPLESKTTVKKNNGGQNVSTQSTTVNIRREFNQYLDSADKFPISFVYAGTYFDGLAGFKRTQFSETTEGEKTCIKISYLHPDGKLQVNVDAVVYETYNAYEWTVYFTNVSKENSAILSDVWGADFNLVGKNALLKTNVGDYGGHFAPYEKQITENGVEIVASTGRSTEEYMPYFNIETDDGGVMMAIGWSGTWTAQFTKEDGSTHVRAKGTNNLSTYLKPGETVRTPLMAFVRYYQRNEDVATNAWRRWVINCKMPRDSWDSDEPLSASATVGFVSDTSFGWYRGGSEFENSTTWQASVNAVKKHNLKFDYHWFDAGWYYSPSGQSLPDTWFSVGSWELDASKWPGNSFKQYTTAVKQELGAKGSTLWFEPERFNGSFKDIQSTYGVSSSWYIPAQGANYLVWHGNPDAVDWLFNQITTAMEKAGIYVYREDHNFAPIAAFLAGDELQGANRHGITENLHFQGKYKLWERILEWQKQTGRASFIEMQSAGGNRQDLALLSYSVSFYRSDSDITLDPPATVSKINALNKWIPYGGVLFGRVSDTDSVNPRDKYQWRATYSSQLCVPMQFQNMSDETWELLEWGLQEYERYKEFVFADFYELTEWKPLYDTDKWVSRMYFDPDSNRGVLETFCFPDCSEGKFTVKLRGLDPYQTYALEDPDGINGVNIISGKVLMEGYTIYLQPRSSSILWITPVEA